MPPHTDQSRMPALSPAKWFAEEVQPHESALRSYLRNRFPTAGEVDDLVQDTFVRILRARDSHTIDSARAFLFGIARRLAIDHLRRLGRTPVHEPVTEFHAASVLTDERSVAEVVCTRQELELLAEAIDALPARCREIVVLRKLDGLSHREIAGRLGLSEETVQVQVGRGMRRCAAFLRRRGVVAASGGADRAAAS